MFGPDLDSLCGRSFPKLQTHALRPPQVYTGQITMTEFISSRHLELDSYGEQLRLYDHNGG